MSHYIHIILHGIEFVGVSKCLEACPLTDMVLFYLACMTLSICSDTTYFIFLNHLNSLTLNFYLQMNILDLMTSKVCCSTNIP